MSLSTIYQNSLDILRTKKWEVAVFIVVLSLGIFVRVFHFSDWLFFEIDQAYDFNLVSPAVTSGIENLPLLGPNVGGGLLRLGPAFYVLEYLSALLFGNTPVGHAGTVLVFSLLSLPLFFLFCRRYFSTHESLGLLMLFSVSLFNVLYARFSWSPNVLPFLMLLSSYALLRSVSKRDPNPARWFLIAVTAITITSQIHFNSFFAAPLIAILFIAIKRPKFHWGIWLSGIAIIFLLYAPVIANDIKTNGENAHYLKAKLLKTSARIAPPLQTLAQDLTYNAYEYFFILTGNDQVNGVKLSGYGFKCTDCREHLPEKLFAILLFLCASLSFLQSFHTETDRERKNFLLLIGITFIVSLALFYTIAQGYRMYPRFFLLVSPLAIIWYGFLFRLLRPNRGHVRLTIFIAIILLLTAMQLQKIGLVFDQLRTVPTERQSDISVDDIFPNTNRLTLEAENLIVSAIVKQYETNHFPVYLSAKSEYEPALWTLLEQQGVPYYNEMGDQSLFAKGNYFDIRYSDGRPFVDPKFTILSTSHFGTLTLTTLRPLPQYIIHEEQPATERKRSEERAILDKLLTWKKLSENYLPSINKN